MAKKAYTMIIAKSGDDLTLDQKNSLGDNKIDMPITYHAGSQKYYVPIDLMHASKQDLQLAQEILNGPDRIQKIDQEIAALKTGKAKWLGYSVTSFALTLGAWGGAIEYAFHHNAHTVPKASLVDYLVEAAIIGGSAVLGVAGINTAYRFSDAKQRMTHKEIKAKAWTDEMQTLISQQLPQPT